jgi:Na+-driven multidrug efflux pump
MWATVSGLLGIGFFVLAEPIVRIFNRDPQVVAMGASFLRWTSVTFVFTAASAVLGRAMTGAGDTFWPMVITGIAMLAFRIPISYALASVWDSARGVWAGMAASNVVQGVLFASAFLWGHWKVVGRRLGDER